jgi:3D (Asp-Asp-Asp) domain-containing protein
MNSSKSIILILISLFLFSALWLEAQASSSFSGLETQIHSWSNTAKIKKVQLALNEFNIYSWEIDWNYSSIETCLLDYQKDSWLIKANTDHGAWYFWVKTLSALKDDFPETFEEVTEKYLQMDIPSTDNRYFYITAYYSPLPGQKKYTTWSYEWDIALNWWWVRSASWKDVFAWLLAAPSNYNFWTKIEFEWLWVWSVEDRWWAIVNSWERDFDFDRIDVWMWYGDDWLERALKWWKRKVKWKVVPNTREVSIQFDTSPVSKYNELTVDAENPNPENVKKLQTLFSELEIYKWTIDWNFDSIKDVLIKYQVDNNIITSKDSHEAWYFWIKTIAVLRKMFGWDIFKKNNNKLDEDIVISKDIKDKLDVLFLKISATIDKKYWKNTIKAIQYRKDIRVAIDKQTAKIKSDLRKKQLKYIKSLL